MFFFVTLKRSAASFPPSCDMHGGHYLLTEVYNNIEILFLSASTLKYYEVQQVKSPLSQW